MDSSQNDARPPSAADALVLLTRRLPKAELHMHLTGSLSPAEFTRLSARATGTRPSATDVDRGYDNLGPGKFFADLDVAARLWSDPDALFEATSIVIRSAFDRGASHLELLCTPSLSRQQAGVPLDESLRAIDAAFVQARTTFGVSGGLIVELHRPDAASEALEVVETAIRLRDDGARILGIGNDGDHRTSPMSALASAYRLAQAAGFRTTGHVMSSADAQVALELGFDRIDHGWLLAEHPDLLARLSDAGTVVTFTPMAYLLGGHQATLSCWQAYAVIDEAGIPIVIGTDDPALHHTDLDHSYQLAGDRLGWGAAEFAAAARGSFRDAWRLPDDEAWIVSRLAEIDRLESDPRGTRP